MQVPRQFNVFQPLRKFFKNQLTRILAIIFSFSKSATLNNYRN